MMLQKLQTFVVTLTTIGVWSNLYINYQSKKESTKLENRKRTTIK